MRKSLFARATALVLCSAMLAVPLCACNKEVDLDDEQIVNFTEPAVGEEIVVLSVRNYGDVKIKLFPEETEKGVENFKSLVNQGFYDELIFHRVEKNFVIQGGDPKGDGTGGVDCWNGNGFAQTISSKLCHFTGAVAYAIASDKLNKSQFYFITGKQVDDAYFQTLAQTYGKGFSATVKQMYQQYGGEPFLDGGYEIFGQVFDGMDYVLQMQDVAVNAKKKPKEAIVIDKAVVTTYDGSGVSWMNWKGQAQNGTSKTDGSAS